jgi:CheY-like chemotaxis protein
MSTILVVDDEPDMIEVWMLFLRRAGHEIVQAYDGLEALYLAQTYLPDLVILDLMMPTAGGDLVLGFLRSTPELKQTPVLVISAHPRGETLARDLEADGFLAKPVELESFQAAVDHLLKTSTT